MEHNLHECHCGTDLDSVGLAGIDVLVVFKLTRTSSTAISNPLSTQRSRMPDSALAEPEGSD